MKLSELLITTARKAKISAGNNGPYKDPETIFRNAAHWAIIFSYAYKKTKNKQFFQKAKEQGRLLLSKKARPHGWTFHARKNTNKDNCNGLMGQAWIIEALVELHKLTKDKRYVDLAEKIFLMHPFTGRYWKRREINGLVLRQDLTFNHQLWFAAAGSMLKNDDIRWQVEAFMDKLETSIHTHPNGLIHHLCYAPFLTPIYLIKNKLTGSPINSSYLYKKEAAYHAFNCYALALLKKAFPKHKFWRTKTFWEILSYSRSPEHARIAAQNKYGTAYNPSGIETAYFLQVFKRKPNKHTKALWKAQFEQHYKNHRLSEKTPDPHTLTARLYEATRLTDRNVPI